MLYTVWNSVPVCLGLRHQEELGLAQRVSEGLQLRIPCLTPPPLTKFIQVRTGSLLEVSVPPAGRCLDFLFFVCHWLSSYSSEVTVFLALLCSPHIWGVSHLPQLSRSKLQSPVPNPKQGSAPNGSINAASYLAVKNPRHGTTHNTGNL